MRSKVVAILETRTGAHLGELIARRGAVPMLAPALKEVPEVDPEAVASLLDGWHTDPFKVVIFQTGVGTRALFQATDALARTDEMLRLLAAAVVAGRGPKPTGEVDARQRRVGGRAPSPFTPDDVLRSLAGIALDRAAVLVQRYGA